MLTIILATWVVGLLTYNWVLRSALNELWKDYDDIADSFDDVWQWVVNANGRRKRVERYLKKQQAKYRRLSVEHQALAADLVAEMLSAQDREAVAKSLTRKVP